LAEIRAQHIWANEGARPAILVVAITASATCGIAVAIVVPNYTYLAIGAVLIVVAAVSVNLLLAGVMLMYSLAFSTYLDHQLSIGPFPVSGLDIIPLVFIAGGVIHLRRGAQSGQIHGVDLWLGAFLLFFTCVAVIDLTVVGTNAYFVLQEYRSILYLAGTYFATRVLVRSPKHVRVLVIFALIAGVIVSFQEYWLIYTNASYNLNAGGIRQLRDSLIQPAAIPAFLVLALAFRSPKSIPRWLVWMLLAVYVPSIPLSFARNQWIGAAVALVALACLVRSVSLVKGIVASAILALAIVWFVAQSPLSAQIWQTFTERTASVLAGQDVSVQGRLDEISRVWEASLAQPVSIFIGQGFGLASALVSLGGGLESHNAYASYYRIGGLLGLALFMVPLLIILKRSTVLSWSNSTGFLPAIQLAVAVSIVFWVVTSLANRAFFQWTDVPLVGVWFGLATTLPDMIHPATKLQQEPDPVRAARDS
jgi:hypothetical protein